MSGSIQRECLELALRFQLDLVFQAHMNGDLYFYIVAEKLVAYAIPRAIATKLLSCEVSAMPPRRPPAFPVQAEV